MSKKLASFHKIECGYQPHLMFTQSWIGQCKTFLWLIWNTTGAIWLKIWNQTFWTVYLNVKEKTELMNEIRVKLYCTRMGWGRDDNLYYCLANKGSTIVNVIHTVNCSIVWRQNRLMPSYWITLNCDLHHVHDQNDHNTKSMGCEQVWKPSMIQ